MYCLWSQNLLSGASLLPPVCLDNHSPTQLLAVAFCWQYSLHWDNDTSSYWDHFRSSTLCSRWWAVCVWTLRWLWWTMVVPWVLSAINVQQPLWPFIMQVNNTWDRWFRHWIPRTLTSDEYTTHGCSMYLGPGLECMLPNRSRKAVSSQIVCLFVHLMHVRFLCFLQDFVYCKTLVTCFPPLTSRTDLLLLYC